MLPQKLRREKCERKEKQKIADAEINYVKPPKKQLKPIRRNSTSNKANSDQSSKPVLKESLDNSIKVEKYQPFHEKTLPFAVFIISIIGVFIVFIVSKPKTPEKQVSNA